MASDEQHAPAPKKGRVTKVVMVDKELRPIAAVSQQSDEDPFTYGGVTGLVEPPYSPDQLNALAEKHSTHGAAIEQKTMDITGGWEWEKLSDDAKDEDKDAADEWFRNLADAGSDESVAEILNAAWMDVETVGYGGIEIAKDATGKVQKIFSLPAHTFRIHKSGIKIAQGRTGRRTWYKRWMPGDKRIVDKKNGNVYEDRQHMPQGAKAGNEVLILRRPTRRKSFYGVPGYVSAMGWIFLSIAARDDNIQFFNNRREPRWVVILKNIEEDADLEAMLRDAFTTSLDSPHRNVFIPIEGEGAIEFKQLTSDAKDISFDKLQERSSNEVLLAHRIPPDRLGAVRVGPLGGNSTMAASRVYKEAVVSTSQDILSERINRFVKAEYNPDLPWKWKPRELDLTEEAEDTATVTNGWINGLYRLDEARKKLKMPEVGGKEGKMFFHEFTAGSDQQGVMAANNAARSGAQLGALVNARRTMMGGVAASRSPDTLLRDVDAYVRAVLLDELDDDNPSSVPSNGD